MVLAIAGCGRLGFEAEPDAVVALCESTKVGSVVLDGAPLALRAVPLSTGYGVAIGTAAGNVYAIRVAPNLTVESTHLPMTGGYVLQGASQLSDRLFIHANLDTGSFVKALEVTWDSYTTAASGAASTLDPPMAPLPGGAQGVLGTIDGGKLQMQIVPADLTATLGVDVSLAAARATLLVHPDGVRALADDGAGTCSAVVVPPDGITRDPRTVTNCELVHAASDRAGTLAIATRRAGELALTTLVADATLDPTLTRLGPGSEARVALVADEPWVAYRDGSVRLARVADGSATIGIAELAGPFDLVTDRLFWLDGGDLQTARPCLAP